MLLLIAYYIIGGFALLFGTWLLYINVMLIKNKYEDDGKKLPWYLWAIGVPSYIVGLPADILFNIVYASVIYRKRPDYRSGATFKKHMRLLTFTHRLRRIVKGEIDIDEDDYRWRLTLFICMKMLEPWDPGHCGLNNLRDDREL